MTIRVVLADDHTLVRSALQMVIADAPDMAVAGEAGTGAEAVRLAGEIQPDVVVMDIRMPEMDGIEATRQITAGTPGTRVVVLTTFDDDDYIYGALRAGASGFLLKDMALDDILGAIRTVAAGDSLIAPSVTRRLIEAFIRPPGPAAGQPPASAAAVQLPGPVTQREGEVLALIGRGLSNSEIAARLSITMPTVKTYVGRLLTKLNARDRVHLVIIAYETGLVTPAPRPGS